MISVQDIKQKSSKWWDDGSFLSATVLGKDDYFPKEVSKIGKVDRTTLDVNYTTILKEQEALINASKEKKGFGYELLWKEVNNQKTGKNKFIDKISFRNQTDFLKFLGREKDFERFNENVKKILDEFPELKKWIVKNPISIVEYAKEWDDLLKVCRYFKGNYIPNRYFIRELPIQIHTKFIERNENIIDELLLELIPDRINLEGKDFCSKYFLKNKERLIRTRILCAKLKKSFAYEDFAVRLSDFKKQAVQCKNIFLTENEMNFLTLPQLQDSIAIWSGGGFNVANIANVDWLGERNIYYWGDLDAAGLLILQQLKAYYPKAQSLMMDRVTFDQFYKEGKTTKKLPSGSFKSQVIAEQELFSFLNEGMLRLEQEHIPQEYVNQILNKIV
jgi:hypothetical protein